jgi:Rad3-related DNA helicase
MNYLIGSSHYPHTAACDLAAGAHGLDCPYSINKRRAINGEDTVFNGHSLFFLNKHHKDKVKPRQVVVIDEAHKVLSYLRDMASRQFSSKDWEFSESDTLNDFRFVQWMQKQEIQVTKELSRLSSLSDKKSREYTKLLTKKRLIEKTRFGFECEPEKYSVCFVKAEHESLIKVECTSTPSWVIRTLCADAEKVILLSGTLFQNDIREFFGLEANYEYFEAPSPIPIENRPIYYRPAPFPVNRDTPAELIAQEIELTLDWAFEKAGEQNTIIHIPYSWQGRLTGMFSKYNVLHHDNNNKKEVLKTFKTDGGILLASGMSEGISLDYDMARVNIIPTLLRPNLGAASVKKKRGLIGGELDYRLVVLKTFMQQVGRTTRAADDFSITIVMDPQFPRLILETEKYIPKWLYDSFIWRNEK